MNMDSEITLKKPVRHIMNISGGKDSSALAIYMRDRDMWRERLGKPVDKPSETIEFEYAFCDTQEELTETYEYLDKLEAYLGKKIIRLSDERGFKHWLEVYGKFLPSPQMRWCTVQLKIKPFERFVGNDPVISYVGIRGDEDRDGYISTKPNIKAVFPFKEDGIDRDDVIRILEESGAGMPEYYKWRTRSGCYFCFFQRKSEWVGLKENHPELFEQAKNYEKVDIENGTSYTWSQGESLAELAEPERVAQIKAHQAAAITQKKKSRPNRPLIEIFSEVLDDEDDSMACNICHI
jgi:3'-phosphoadenosine 5'-phosphosulfate sulfotransferase (PAPS reductase)/FAD synthetase